MQGIWDRITYENDMIPSTGSEHAGWWNADKSIMTMEDLHNNGWRYETELVVDWDSQENVRDVQERVDL